MMMHITSGLGVSTQAEVALPDWRSNFLETPICVGSTLRKEGVAVPYSTREDDRPVRTYVFLSPLDLFLECNDTSQLVIAFRMHDYLDCARNGVIPEHIVKDPVRYLPFLPRLSTACSERGLSIQLECGSENSLLGVIFHNGADLNGRNFSNASNQINFSAIDRDTFDEKEHHPITFHIASVGPSNQKLDRGLSFSSLERVESFIASQFRVGFRGSFCVECTFNGYSEGLSFLAEYQVCDSGVKVIRRMPSDLFKFLLIGVPDLE